MVGAYLYSGMSLLNTNQTEERRYDFSFERIAGQLKFAPKKVYTLAETFSKVGSAAVSCFAGHLLYFGLTYQHQAGTNPFMLYLTSASRVTFHSFMTFGSKVVIDAVDANEDWYLGEHKKGALVGLFSYLVTRPFDQIAAVKNEIFTNQGKHIGGIEACHIIVKHDGLRGFYRYENLLGPTNFALHRSVLFGTYQKLSRYSSNELYSYLLAPFLSSFAASLTTLMPDKLRSYYINSHHMRNTSLQRRNKKILLNDNSITKELFLSISSGKFSFTKTDLTVFGTAVVRNWLMMGLFVAGQRYLELQGLDWSVGGKA